MRLKKLHGYGTNRKVPKTIYFLSGFLVLSPTVAFASGVLVNEALFDPSGTDSGLEWVEIFNSSDASVDLSGWELYPDGVGYFSLPQGFTLDSKNFALIHIRASGTNSKTDLYHPTASGNMGNTAGSIALFSGEPRGKDTIKSFLQWGRAGETWEGDAEKAGLWTKGTFIDTSELKEGDSVALAVDGVTTGGKIAWKVATLPTPGKSNSVSLVESADSAVSSSTRQNSASSSDVSSVPLSQSGPLIPPGSIKAYAGGDVTVNAGALVEFSGHATDLSGGPLINARFWWNFGDGGSFEGRSAAHIFGIPGKYIVGLHVSSDIYAASDYLTVNVLPNQLLISDVVAGGEGFLKIRNSADTLFDIGEWILEDVVGRRFAIPSRTKIASKSDMAFANRLTGLFSTSDDTAKLFYPNGTIAYSYVKPAAPHLMRTEIISSNKEKSVDEHKIVPDQTEAERATTAPVSLGKNMYPASSVKVENTSLFLFGALALGIFGAALYFVGKLFLW